MQSMVLSRESISSVYAVVIPVRPPFATSSPVQTAGIRSDTIIGTSLRRACGASCIRLAEKTENAKKMDQKQQFSVRGIFILLAAEKTNFFRRGITSKLASR